MSDLDGLDAFDKLLEVALESRVDVRRAQEERDAARSAQSEAERLAAERQSKIIWYEQRDRRSALVLRELWEAAEAVRSTFRIDVTDENQRAEFVRLTDALEASRDYCDQPPF